MMVKQGNTSRSHRQSFSNLPPGRRPMVKNRPSFRFISRWECFGFLGIGHNKKGRGLFKQTYRKHKISSLSLFRQNAQTPAESACFRLMHFGLQKQTSYYQGGPTQRLKTPISPVGCAPNARFPLVAHTDCCIYIYIHIHISHTYTYGTSGESTFMVDLYIQGYIYIYTQRQSV